MNEAGTALRMSLAFLLVGCAPVRLADLELPDPISDDACIVIGFLGGRDDWDNECKSVRALALRLRNTAHHTFAETFSNRDRELAEGFLLHVLDDDRNGAVDVLEKQRVTLVVYGQSFGGAATVKFARRLAEIKMPVYLTVQVDSVGRGDGTIPPNVRFAANLYQDDGWLITGEHPIRAEDPSRTLILGNWPFSYRRPPGSEIRLDDLPWWKIFMRVAHTKMDRDSRVWDRVESLIRAACSGEDLEHISDDLDPRA